MEPAPEPSADDVTRLRGCLNDLRGIMTATDLWVGREPPRIVTRSIAALSEIAHALESRHAQHAREIAVANDALRDGERNSRLLIDSIPGLVALLTPAGEVEFVNHQILEFTGQTLDELKQWGTNGTVHEEDLPHVIEVFSESIGAGRPYEILQRLRRSDGTYRWFQNNGFPLRDASGRVVRWCVLLTDVDQRKRAEEALRTSEHNLKLIIDTIPALAWSARPDGNADFFSKHYLDFVGLSTEQAGGWGWTAAVHPDDVSGLAETWRGIIASEAPGEAVARLRRHDGQYRWLLFRANPLRDQSGRIVKWYGVNTDIEDRKQAEDALRRSEAFLLEVQRLSHTGGWRYDLAADVVESSLEIRRGYDVQPGEDVSKTPFWFDRIHPDDRPRVEAEFERCLRDKCTYRSAHRIVLPDGSVRFQDVTGHPVTNDAGELVEFVGAAMDMTDYWRTTTELAQASEALRELQKTMSRAVQVATVGELAASIAHEVNQPLSGVITNAHTCRRMLAAEPPNLDGAREAARRIVRDGDRASDVITRVRALFMKKPFTLESLDLNEAAGEVIALSMGDCQRHQISLESELAHDLPMVSGDRLQLQQVILNLLRNAVEAMVDVRDRPRTVVLTTEREDAERVRLTVRDCGVGLDPLRIDTLFDAFQTTKEDGMGIGLSISRSIITRHQGRLWAQQNDGPGATFAFSIPRRLDDHPAAESQLSNTKV